MNSLTFLLARRLPWLQLPAVVLITLLQRTPVLRVISSAESALIGSPLGQVLRSSIAIAATMGMVDTLAGATTLSTTPTSPASATVGVTFSAAFAITGAPVPTQSYTIANLPPGLTVPNATTSGGQLLLNGGSGTISGTPTSAGAFDVDITAFEFSNASGRNRTFTFTINVAGSAATAPSITTQPAGQTITAGQSVTFSVAATGTDPLSYQWRKDGTAISGATTASHTIASTTLADAGSYTVVVTNAGGSATSAGATLVVNPAPAVTAPAIVTAPASQTIAPGGTATFTVDATGTAPLAYQWFKDDVAISGETSSTLTFANLTGSEAGDYTVAVTNAGGTATSSFARLVVATPSPGRLINVSVRSVTRGGQSPLIVGFVVGGSGRSVLIRSTGPALVPLGVGGVLPDPRIDVHATVNGADTIAATNDDWAQAGVTELENAFKRTGAFMLEADSKDAALILPVAGPRTIHAVDTQSRTGVTLVEVYDLADDPENRIINVSARNFVGTGEQILIAGFVISGNAPKQLLIRGAGPELNRRFGITSALTDPKIEIHTTVSRNGVGVDRVVATSDDWSTANASAIKAAFATTGAFEFPDGSKDAALLVELPAGVYTVLLAGKNDETGEALVEVYEMP